jgi:hypothetical protein
MIYTKNYNLESFFDELFPEKIIASTDQIVTILFNTTHTLGIGQENKIAYSKLAIQLESLNIVNHYFFLGENTENDFIQHLKIKPSDITTVYGDNLDSTARKIYTKLLALKQAFFKPDLNTAVFGVLPPEISGIAYFNAKTFGISKQFHIYSDFANYNYYDEASNNITKENNISSINIFPIANSLFNYKKKIFVLGNSTHNIPYFKAAIKEKDKKNCFLFCHEINLSNLLFFYLTLRDYKQIIKTVYPDLFYDSFEFDNLPVNNIREAVRYGFRGILFLTNITNIIVNNDKAKQLLLDDIKNTIYENTVSIKTVFLPVTKINVKTDTKLSNIDYDGLKIGTFGMCINFSKAVDIIIKSVVLLNEKYNIKSKCILAGYNVDEYILSEVPSELHRYILGFSDCSQDQLFSIMDQVDIAVQLRNNPHGESSGVIHQLLGLNKKVIVSEKFLDNRLESFCTIVPRFISEDALARVLYDTYKNNIGIDASILFKKFGFSNLAEAILEI